MRLVQALQEHTCTMRLFIINASLLQTSMPWPEIKYKCAKHQGNKTVYLCMQLHEQIEGSPMLVSK